MTTKTRQPLVTIGTILFILGAVVGLWLLVTSAWGDLEAMLFDSALGSDEPLTTLNCPIMITPTDIGVISANFENPGDKERKVIVQARFSLGHRYYLQEQRDEIYIPPGESISKEYEVFANQAAFGRIILARIYQYRSFSVPSRTGSCGIIVVDLPNFTGGQVLVSSLAGSLALMALGISLRAKSPAKRKSQQKKLTQGMTFLGAQIIIGILISFLGSWMLSVLMVVFSLIIIIGVISFLS